MNVIEATPAFASRVIKTEPARWADFQYIQQLDFKSWTAEAKEKLKKSILENEFTTPFYVWHDMDQDVIFCLDGRHRTLAMEELRNEGHIIPELLDATFIRCQDRQEAATLVLVYSSIYAKISQQGLFDFIKMYDLEYDKLKSQIDIPEFSTDRFEQKMAETAQHLINMIQQRNASRQKALDALQSSPLDNIPDDVKKMREIEARSIRAVMQEQIDLIEIIRILFLMVPTDNSGGKQKAKRNVKKEE